MGLKLRNGMPDEDQKVLKVKGKIKSTNRNSKTQRQTETKRQTDRQTNKQTKTYRQRWTSWKELHNSAADRAGWQKSDWAYLPLGEREKQRGTETDKETFLT